MAFEETPARRSVGALGAYFVGDVSVADALQKICDAAVDAVPRAEQAGISMTVDARIGTYVFTHPEVKSIDQAQYDTGDGPCVEAFRTGRPVVVASMQAEGPYPAFRRAALAHGFRSSVSVPMVAGDHVVGALNLYAREAEAFTLATATDLESFATHAAFVLRNHQAYWDARSLSENLTQAMASRAVIEQAKGIIMATSGCTPDEAFERLRQQSQHENVKVRDIATEIVRRAQRH